MTNDGDKMSEITPKTLVYDLLNDYPELEDKLIEIAPIFIKLKNPVLRRTIAKITTLKQASVVGDVPLSTLINQLRKAAGQELLLNSEENITTYSTETPEWVQNRSLIIYDAREDIENGIHPLGKVMGDIKNLNNHQTYKLITSFMPAPLIEKVKEKGYLTWINNSDSNFETHIAKVS